MSLKSSTSAFRRLIAVVLAAGTAGGLVVAALQFITVEPLILKAEMYEQAEHSGSADAAGANRDWQPSDGLERNVYTVLGTVLTGIAFSALLFGLASLLGLDLDQRGGLWLGLAGFASCALAPALGLPPRPPGVTGAELHAAQSWWAITALATAAGIWTLARANGRWTWRSAGVACLLAPHLFGAPQAIAAAPSLVPHDLIRRFAIISVATQGVFWLLLGGLGGRLYAAAFGSAARE